MDNNTTDAAVSDDLSVSDVVKVIAVEAAKATVISAAQVTVAYAGLAAMGYTAVKIQEARQKRAAKKAAAAIETAPEND